MPLADSQPNPARPSAPPRPPTYRLHDCIVDGSVIVLILVGASILGTVIADHVMAKLSAAHCHQSQAVAQ
jgi:hypothetical protein